MIGEDTPVVLYAVRVYDGRCKDKSRTAATIVQQNPNGKNREICHMLLSLWKPLGFSRNIPSVGPTTLQ